ncbi:MAG: hypothetical protein P8M16_05230 [Acidimicrobiales bacterium]|nr:hypothetical protein [Acidimicrobiales bacterium]
MSDPDNDTDEVSGEEMPVDALDGDELEEEFDEEPLEGSGEDDGESESDDDDDDDEAQRTDADPPDDDDDDEVEADLDAILRDRIAAEEDEEEEEDPDVVAPPTPPPSPGGLVERQEDELHCPHCFLLVQASTVAESGECGHCGGPIS